jgi:hypothetical protein
MSKVETVKTPIPADALSGVMSSYTRKGADGVTAKKNRRGFRNRHHAASGATMIVQRQVKFEGKCEKLKGYIYDCTDVHQSDMFMKTTKEIDEFVGSTYKQGGDICQAVEGLSLPNLQEPPDPPDDATKTQLRMWEKKVDEFVKRQLQLEENIQTLYSLVWGQCTDIMHQKIEALDVFTNMSEDKDGLELLRAIKDITYNFQSQKKLSQALHKSKRRYYTLMQGKHVTTQAYLEQYQNVVDVLEHSGAHVGLEPGLMLEFADKREKSVEELTEEDEAEIKERYHGVAFLLGSDRNRFGKLIEDLENEFLRGHDNFPRSLTNAYHLLTNWKCDPRNTLCAMGPTNDGVSFMNDGAYDAESINLLHDGKGITKKLPMVNKSNITCCRCNQKGHYASE